MLKYILAKNIHQKKILPVHNSSPSPSYPGLHLQAKCDGTLQHSAFSTHLDAIDGSAHSSISVINNNLLVLNTSQDRSSC